MAAAIITIITMIGARGTATAMDTAIAIVSADTDTAAALGAGTITTTEAPLRQDYLHQEDLRPASAKPGEDERAAPSAKGRIDSDPVSRLLKSR